MFRNETSANLRCVKALKKWGPGRTTEKVGARTDVTYLLDATWTGSGHMSRKTIRNVRIHHWYLLFLILD